MFKKIAIANRGEIALRIHKAARELGIKTVALHSAADSNQLHVKLADEKICIGGPEVKNSYLNMNSIISAAQLSKADAIHPGYGFFAENAEFAKLVNDQGIKFIGPSSEIINLMRDKVSARNIMREHGVPCVPGSYTTIQNNSAEVTALAENLGYPVVIKAAFGGGGRAIRVVYKPANLFKTIELTQQEAAAMFGNDSVYLEKYIENPRHVEVQILGDGLGNVIHLGMRDCSTQRWNKKIIEESPAIDIPDILAIKLLESCIKVCSQIKYAGLGTLEFLYFDNNFYFNEMNTRVQVGHTVTELITGLDLVKEQIKIAAGVIPQLQQSDVNFQGHAIQCRVYAEDPRTFTSSYGKITSFYAPGGPGIRVDSHIYDGYVLPTNYDTLIAKVIAHGDTRQHAVTRMHCALEELMVKGVKTNIALLQFITQDPDFISGKFKSDYLEKKLGPR